MEEVYKQLKSNTYMAGDCQIYGAIDRYSDLKKVVGGRHIRIAGHRLALLIKLNDIELPRGLECSHLCHNKGCVTLGHLEAEPHAVNMDRNRCRFQREETGQDDFCFGHEFCGKKHPKCL